MTLLTIENNELRLNSTLTEYEFGKTKYDSVVTQEGVIFDGKNFLQWSFEEVKSYSAEKNGSKENLVFYCVKNPLSANAKTLAEYFEQDGESCLQAVKTVCTAITTAALNENQIPEVGPEGILIDGDKVLFLPETLFKYAVNSLSAEDALKLHSGFINETIKGLPALCFERAAIIYRLLAKTLPFTATDSVTRNADILDRKFLPIEYCVNGIDPELALAINTSLKLNANAVNIPGKKKRGKTSEELKATAEFPLEKLDEAYKLSLSTTRDKNFEEKKEAYLKSQNSKINTKRKIKQNTTTITVIALVLLALGIITLSTIKSHGEKCTSIGLTSTQTIQAYLGAANSKDSELLSDFSNGKTTDNFNDMVSRIYVMHKQRVASGSRDNGFAYPSNWLFYITTPQKYNQSGVYGITNLKIDDKALPLFVELQKIKDKPEPLTKEGNITLEDGITSVHKIEFYSIITEGEVVDFTVEKITGTITLTYKKNRWLVTELNYNYNAVPADCDAFKTDYFKAVRETEGDIIKASDSLRDKYPWLPETDALQREKARIDYELANPYAILGF